MNESLGRFFSEKSSEQIDKVKKGTDNASSEERKSVPIAHAGNYLCEVSTFAYNKDEKDKQFPDVYISTEKGSLNLAYSLKVVDGTEMTPAGSSIFANITLCPGGELTEESVSKVMNFSKPKLIALTGCRSIDISEAWIKEWLVPVFEKQPDGKTFKLIRDHKMKNRVMVIVDFDSHGKLAVKSVTKANSADKSITYETKAPVGNVNIPGSSAPSFANVADHGDNSSAPADIPHVPEVEEF